MLKTSRRSLSCRGGESSLVGCARLIIFIIGLHGLPDEAHKIKSRTAKVTVACCNLTARYRWCFTGTPL